MLAGDASRTLSEMHFRIAILRSKVRPETFLKLINAIPLPNTDLTVIQRSEPEVGLNVDEERIPDHMPRPVTLNGTDEDTKLLGALVHWVMRNNLLTRLNTYSAIQASRDLDVSYTKLKRVITGVWQHRGSYCHRWLVPAGFLDQGLSCENSTQYVIYSFIKYCHRWLSIK